MLPYLTLHFLLVFFLSLKAEEFWFEAKALATLIFAVIRGSACGISGECDSFYSGNKNGHLLFLVQLRYGIILVHPHIPVLPTNGHTDSFNMGYHSDSFQHTLAY